MDIEKFINESIMSHIPKFRETAPIIIVDECANHPEIDKAIQYLIKNKLALIRREAWSQLRKMSDGTFAHWEGYRRGIPLPEGFDLGVPIKGWSISDKQVIQNVIANFITADRLVFLSENTRNNIGGLKRILFEEIQPILEKSNHNRFGLLALMKKGKTKWEHYAAELKIIMSKETVKVGFEYRVI
jgi:hypothetical protein